MPSDTIVPPGGLTVTHPETAPKQSGVSWINSHKGTVIGGSIAVGLVGFLILHQMNKNKTSATSSQNSSIPATSTPQYMTSGSGYDTNTGDYYAGLLNAIDQQGSTQSAGLSSAITQLEQYINSQTSTQNPGGGTTAPPSGAPQTPPPSNPTWNGPGTETIQGNEYYVLGSVDNSGFTGYNVSGGAPVFATWTGNGTPTQGFDTSTAQPGEVLYTPTSTPLNQISQTIGHDPLR